LKLSFSIFQRPGAGHDLGDGVGRYGQRGHEGAAVGGFAAGVGDGDADPVDQHGVAAVAQRRVLEPAIAVGQALAG